MWSLILACAIPYPSGSLAATLPPRIARPTILRLIGCFTVTPKNLATSTDPWPGGRLGKLIAPSDSHQGIAIRCGNQHDIYVALWTLDLAEMFGKLGPMQVPVAVGSRKDSQLCFEEWNWQLGRATSWSLKRLLHAVECIMSNLYVLTSIFLQTFLGCFIFQSNETRVQY
jgi:hypothetical protein